MADPTKYTPEYSYSGWQATNPSRPLPADEVDNDFANVSRSVNQTIDALKDVRRSDGKLKNQSVGPDQLSPALTIGFTFTGTWIDGQSYSAGDGVVKDDTFYSARVAHTADVSNAPGNTAYWNELFSLNDIVVTGGMSLPRDSFVGDGVTKDFTLSFTALSKFNLFVQVGGVVQGTDAYAANGNILTFINPPPNGYGIEVRGFATVSTLVVPDDGSVTTEKLADLSVTTQKLAELSVTASKLAPAPDIRSFLDTAPYVDTRTELKALDTTKDTTAILTEEGREGIFNWKAGDYSAQIAADTLEGVYIEADAIASTSGAWVRQFDGPINVRWFGATGSGVADDATALSRALEGGAKYVYFPAGEYLIRNYLRLYANTRILMHPDCVILNDNQTQEYVFVNGEYGNATFATGYDGVGDLLIEGGAIDNGPRRTAGNLTAAMAFGHGRNITVRGVAFRNNLESHFLEINACQHVLIENCMFDDLDPQASSNREMINIDYAFAGGFPPFGSYDNTPCDDVVVRNNKFKDGQVAVGTHSAPPSAHTRILVIENDISDMSGIGIRANNWNNSKVNDNRAQNTGSNGIELTNCSDTDALGNTLLGTNQTSSGAALFVNLGSRCRVGRGRISNSGYGTNYRVGIDIQGGGADHVIYTNGVDAGTDSAIQPGYGIWEGGASGSERFIVDGAYVATISDDDVSVIPVKAPGRQTLALISMDSATSTSPRGLYWVRADGSTTPVIVSAIAAADVNLTTGVLTGTTGADAKVTISAASNGNLYIENRSGNTRNLKVQFLGQSQ